MNLRRLTFAAFLASLAFTAAHGQSSPLEKTRQARTQIDTLLGPRRNAPPAPTDPANPFATPGATVVDATPNNPAPIAPISTEQDVLTRVIKIGGTAMLGGRQQLIVNGLAYKEGDLFTVRDGDQVMRVRLVRIAPPSAVFEYNGNEVILRIRN